jgi:mannose/fructose/N-acetylgalactosamine-specific phosphotransferase system component IID
MIKVAFDVAVASQNNWLLILAPLSALLLIKTKINPTTLILGGVVIGILLSLV